VNLISRVGLGILILLSLLGCSGKSSPIVSSTNKNLTAFANAIDIFGGNADSTGFQPSYHDVALSQIRTYGNETGVFINNGTFAVTLNRDGDINPNDEFKPVFRWLDAADAQVNPNDPPRYVAERDFIDDNNTFDYRALNCDSIFNVNTQNGSDLASNPYIIRVLEVVVCYQIRENPQDDWDIGVTELRWIEYDDPINNENDYDDVDHFWEKEPSSRQDVIFDEWTDGIITDMDHDEYNPDIAYDFDNGDIYLVYTNVENNPNHQVLKYRYLQRNQAFPAINNENYAQDDITGHNAFDPCIDIGKITVNNNPLFQDQQTVAIAYTSQFHDPGGGRHKGFHVNVSYWPVDYSRVDHDFVAPMMNRNFPFVDAGLPSLDIAPEWNATNGGVLTYTQVEGSDGFGLITGVYAVGMLGQLADLETHFRISDPNDQDPLGENQAYDDGMYSSISCNQQLGDITFSVTFLHQQDVDNIWIPHVAGLTFTPAVLEPVYIPSQWNIDFDQWIPNTVDVIGNFNVSEIPFINPGISSAIFVDPFNNYWAAWSDRTEMEPPPQLIQAAWGNAQ
jgi:hypothetical protein